MEKRIRIGAVSYLNTKPLLYGIRHSPVAGNIELTEAYPSRIAAMLVNDEIDAGLVPVAIIPELTEAHIISDYCIGADGDVASVCIFSEVPLEQAETLLLDYQSRTSVNLARVLLREFWKKEIRFENAREDFREHIKGTTAGVVIGDRALEQRQISPYVYDLSAAWKQHTGLPFVFAAWVANKQLDNDFIVSFNAANAHGLAHIDEVVKAEAYPVYDLKHYYTENIDYRLDEAKKAGLALFLEKLKNNPR